MHDLVVADRQHEVLRVGVDHRECQQVVLVLAVHRVELQVAQGVVHPAHVPFEPEPQAARIDGLRDARETRRLLCNHADAGLALVEVLVDVAEEVDGLEVLPAAELVGHPFAVVAGVVEVQHGRNRVDPEPVDVELLGPVESVGNEEALHLVAAVVEDVGAPVFVLALARVSVLVECGAVESAEAEGVLGEVAGHPVHDDADAGLVEAVDEVAQIVGLAEARRGGEVAGDLVSPAGGEGVLGERHELDVGVALPLHVLDELFGQLEVRLAATPPAQVHLVDAHRFGVRLGLAALGHPFVVGPDVLRFVDDRRVGGRLLRELRDGVGFLVPVAVLVFDLVLVQGLFAEPLDEQTPHARAGDEFHVVALPVVERAGDEDSTRVRRPDGEPHASDWPALIVVDGDNLRAEPLPDLGIAAVVEPLEIPTRESAELVVCHVFSSKIGVWPPNVPSSSRSRAVTRRVRVPSVRHLQPVRQLSGVMSQDIGDSFVSGHR